MISLLSRSLRNVNNRAKRLLCWVTEDFRPHPSSCKVRILTRIPGAHKRRLDRLLLRSRSRAPNGARIGYSTPRTDNCNFNRTDDLTASVDAARSHQSACVLHTSQQPAARSRSRSCAGFVIQKTITDATLARRDHWAWRALLNITGLSTWTAIQWWSLRLLALKGIPFVVPDLITIRKWAFCHGHDLGVTILSTNFARQGAQQQKAGIFYLFFDALCAPKRDYLANLASSTINPDRIN